ncbi:TonB-dependent receptor family protein [Pseudidiomarina woesei]|uniref:Outer membrane receptor proteins, mostly Fe transport n=1 Tax=Pseudidiomarina woesei TaxID=1381080 RepID=A0A0K6HDD2_9GAMM|nr:TonB-dependent receptor [Pseudidiomarina woesei]CUA88791.1 Outer membrane receptor proteins, mostly Fe transport [Pseudidiomarina woesei]
MLLSSILVASLAATTETSATLASASVAVDEVIVVNQSQPRSGDETPAALTNLDLDEQPEGLRVDAAELLKGVAGVQADSRANYAQDTRITLRGFGARSAFGVRGVILQLDGIPLSMPDGQAQTSSILLDEPANVQIIRGPLATIYGNSAGGVIQWFSERPQATQLSVDIMAGANNTQRQHVQADYVSERSSVRLAGARFRTDGPRQHNSAERDHLALRWYYDLTDSVEMIVRLDDNNAPLLQDPGSLTPTDWQADPNQTFGGAERFNTRKSIHHQQMSLSLRSSLRNESGWHLNAWRGWRDVLQYLPFPGSDTRSSGAVIDLQRSFTGLDASYNMRWNNQWRTTLGAHIAEQVDRRYGFVNDFGQRGDLRRDERGEVIQTALYSLTDWRLNQQWSFTAGLRYSDVEFSVDDYFILPENPNDSGVQQQHAWSWSLGANYQLNDAWRVFAARGHGFETATLTEMAYSNTETGLNTALGPAFNDQWEVGVSWQQAAVKGQLSWFDIQTTDEIVVDQSIDGRTTYTNAGLTERYGAEFEVSWQLTENWNWRGAATWLKATYGNGNRLPGVAEQTAYSQLNWNYQRDHRLSLITEYRGDIAATDDNSVIAPSHTLWHINWRADYVLGNWELSPWLQLHNIGDTQYVGSVVVNQGNGRAFEPGVGREVHLGLGVSHRW